MSFLSGAKWLAQLSLVALFLSLPGNSLSAVVKVPPRKFSGCVSVLMSMPIFQRGKSDEVHSDRADTDSTRETLMQLRDEMKRLDLSSSTKFLTDAVDNRRVYFSSKDDMRGPISRLEYLLSAPSILLSEADKFLAPHEQQQESGRHAIVAIPLDGIDDLQTTIESLKTSISDLTLQRLKTPHRNRHGNWTFHLMFPGLGATYSVLNADRVPVWAWMMQLAIYLPLLESHIEVEVRSLLANDREALSRLTQISDAAEALQTGEWIYLANDHPVLDHFLHEIISVPSDRQDFETQVRQQDFADVQSTLGRLYSRWARKRENRKMRSETSLVHVNLDTDFVIFKDHDSKLRGFLVARVSR